MLTYLQVILLGLSIVLIVYSIVAGWVAEARPWTIASWIQKHHADHWMSLHWIVRKLLSRQIGIRLMRERHAISNPHFEQLFDQFQGASRQAWGTLLFATACVVILLLL